MENPEPQSHARLAVSAVLLVVIGASLIATAYLRTSQIPTSITSSTTIPAPTATNTSASATPTTNTTDTLFTSSVGYVCSITGESGGLLLRVFSDTGSPLSGVAVASENVNQCGKTTLDTVTDSGGRFGVPGTIGVDNFTVRYEGRQYHLGAYLPPLEKVTISLRLPSGYWSIEFTSAGTLTPRFASPSFASTAQNGLSLNATLGNSTIGQGSFLPVKVSFAGPGTSNASHATVTLVVRNTQGIVVGNFSQSVETLFLPDQASAATLRGFTTYLGWNAESHPPDYNTTVTPGTYSMTVESEVGGTFLSAQSTFQVTP